MYANCKRYFSLNVQDVDGATSVVTCCLDTADLKISRDLETDSTDVPAQMGLVGELLAGTQAALDFADAKYRQFRARAYDQIVAAADKKPSEDVIKAKIEMTDEFLTHKEGCASLTGDLEFLRAYFASLQVKSTQLRALLDRDNVAGRTIARNGVGGR